MTIVRARAATADTIVFESVGLNCPDVAMSYAAAVISDSRCWRRMTSAASPTILPFQAIARFLEAATSELMLSMSERMLSTSERIGVALLVIPETGMAEVTVEARRRERRVLMRCILKYEWC